MSEESAQRGYKLPLKSFSLELVIMILSSSNFQQNLGFLHVYFTFSVLAIAHIGSGFFFC